MNKILFVDTLTTGINSERCGIYRIAGIICEEDKGTIRQKSGFDFLMRPFPQARITDESLAIGGMTRSRLIYLPDEKDVFKSFMSKIGEVIDIRHPKDKLYLVGLHSSTFDMPFIRAWFNRCGNEGFKNCFYVQTIDLSNLAAFVLMEERMNMANFYIDNMARTLNVTLHKDEKQSNIATIKTSIEIYAEIKRRLHGNKRTINEDSCLITTNYKNE